MDNFVVSGVAQQEMDEDDNGYYSQVVQENIHTDAAPDEDMKEIEEEDSDDDNDDEDYDDYSDHDDADYYDDIDDDLFDDASCNVTKPLLEPNTNDGMDSAKRFQEVFTARYGESSPNFFQGSLAQAVQQTLRCPILDRRMLALYLHHEGSVASNLFCSQVVATEFIATYLNSYFTTFGWDVTHPTNEAKFLTESTKLFGGVTSEVRNFAVSRYPLLLIISRSRGTDKVVATITRDTHFAEVIPTLELLHEDFCKQKLEDIPFESEWEERENLKREQEEAYRQSLAADKLKAEKKRQEEEMKHQEEERKQHEEEERKRKEEEQKEAEEKQEALRQEAAKRVAEEPPATCQEPVSTLRFRCPDGEILTRRFLADQPLTVVFEFLTSKGYQTPGSYKVLIQYPRRSDLTTVNSTQSLEELKLVPKNTLIVEQKQ